MTLGALPRGDGSTAFTVWAPNAGEVRLLLDDGRDVLLEPDRDRGYFRASVANAPAGTRYRYRLAGGGIDTPLERPDPASRWQPDGVHGASAVVDASFQWREQSWGGIDLGDYAIYELHVGTFTPDGTFAAAIDRLDDLKDLGITAVEVMPVSEFPGGRNWGYDGVFPYAAQSTYGGPDGFRGLVDACHQRGLAVILDVVYNHFGPEGAVQAEFGPYFTEKYQTPWGPAINFDGAGSDEVRRYFIENALWWIDECHVDALRLDAVHAIFDQSAYHFLHELRDAVHARAAERHRKVHVIAETDLNNPRLVRRSEEGGYDLDAQWSDDFHHALHVVLTGEDDGYYADFRGVEELGRALRDGYAYTGQYSTYRQRRHGAPTRGIPGERFVVCTQNHDQVGNRMNGDRLTALVKPAQLRVAAVCLLTSPFVPLLFMGEEYAETAPFLYFVSHTDEQLVADVRRGRREEFAAFRWAGEPPDPQDPHTFERSKLDWSLRWAAPHSDLLDLHGELLALRKEVAALGALDRDRIAVTVDSSHRCLAWTRWTEDGSHALIAVNAGDHDARLHVPAPPGRWTRRLDTREWGGEQSASPDQLQADGHVDLPLAAWTAAVYLREED